MLPKTEGVTPPRIRIGVVRIRVVATVAIRIVAFVALVGGVVMGALVALPIRRPVSCGAPGMRRLLSRPPRTGGDGAPLGRASLPAGGASLRWRRPWLLTGRPLYRARWPPRRWPGGRLARCGAWVRAPPPRGSLCHDAIARPCWW
ncbi:hypothetical protein HMPREF1316_0055 [Olsenella profusa F0195]|uniref:Uncharacterized protein n=1 Tax=Olsenella profusa F0195 TaxID=1125712 RepID=U2TPD0_9ACTN|nr:hypothetical protein HMPREF1316_0055 [Olsenella profusa F0195]